MAWESVSIKGRPWTIEQLFVQWRAKYNRRAPYAAGITKGLGVARVRAAIDANKHRACNGEIPARVFDWMDHFAIVGYD
jgi:hypothetical protein